MNFFGQQGKVVSISISIFGTLVHNNFEDKVLEPLGGHEQEALLSPLLAHPSPRLPVSAAEYRRSGRGIKNNVQEWFRLEALNETVIAYKTLDEMLTNPLMAKLALANEAKEKRIALLESLPEGALDETAVEIAKLTEEVSE